MSLVENLLKYQFRNQALLNQALTHKSYHYESKTFSKGHNEKLEFLGDAVLDLVLSEYLMESFPEDSEGSLSKKRASLVNEGVLSQIAKQLDLSQYIQLGKGEQISKGEQKPRLLASVYEALLGAIFLDSGFEAVRKTARPHFTALIKEMNSTEDYSQDFKTKLQEEVQAVLRETPSYALILESGPPHDRTFEVEVRIKNRALTKATGKSKKIAEQEAARLALEVWKTAKGESR